MKLHVVRVLWVDIFCKAIQLAGKVVGLRLKDGHTAEDEILLVRIRRRPSVIKIKKMHEQKKCGQVGLTPFEPRMQLSQPPDI